MSFSETTPATAVSRRLVMLIVPVMEHDGILAQAQKTPGYLVGGFKI